MGRIVSVTRSYFRTNQGLANFRAGNQSKNSSTLIVSGRSDGLAAVSAGAGAGIGPSHAASAASDHAVTNERVEVGGR